MGKASAWRKQKLELRPPSDSSEEESDEGSDSSSPVEGSAWRNPFEIEVSENDGEEDEDDDDDEDVEVYLATMAESAARPKAPCTDSKQDGGVERRGKGERSKMEAGEELFALSQKYFSMDQEVKSSRGMIALQYNMWLLPNSSLMEDLKKVKFGNVRWQSYNPEDELYFKMKTTRTSGDDKWYNWEPTERYLVTWKVVEMLIGTSNISGVFDFVQSHPYHPSCNLCIAEYYVQTDQFDTAHKFIERALASFQYGLSPNLQFQKDPHKRHRLEDLDLRKIAESLSVLGDDLEVAWGDDANRDSSDGSRPQKQRQRESEIRAALSIPENGNLLFIRCLHMYGWSLFQRGIHRVALEIFRFLNVLTLGNDLSHSLLVISETMIRAKEHEMFCKYNQKYFEATKDIVYAQYDGLCLLGASSVAGSGDDVPQDDEKDGALPFTRLLESVLPSFLFGRVTILIREGGLRASTELSTTTAVLDDISLNDFDEYVASRAHTTDGMNGGTSASLREACVALMYSVWQYPSFIRMIRDRKRASAPGAQISTSTSDMESTLAGLGLFSPHFYNDGFRKLRERLLEAYVMQSAEYWMDYYDSVILPVGIKVGTFMTLHHQFQIQADVLLTQGFQKHAKFMKQYLGVRPSEFDGQKFVIADALLNSGTESVGTHRGYHIRQELTGAALNPLRAWWERFMEHTGSVNAHQNIVLSFLQTLMPWAALD